MANKRKCEFVQEVYEIIIDNKYYGTLKVPKGTPVKKRIAHVGKIFPKLINKTCGVDYELKFIQMVTPIYAVGDYSEEKLFY